jgi:hypothetical protein
MPHAIERTAEPTSRLIDDWEGIHSATTRNPVLLLVLSGLLLLRLPDLALVPLLFQEPERHNTPLPGPYRSVTFSQAPRRRPI